MAWDCAVSGLKELFRNPVQGLCWIELEKVGAVAFPKCFFAFLNSNSSKAVNDTVVGSFKSSLLNEFLHGLHPKSNEIDGIGDAEGDSNIEVVEDGLANTFVFVLLRWGEHYFLIIIFL